MTRIQRLLGVQPGTQTRPGGWMASIAITITVVAACSAITLARPHHDEHAEHAEHETHDAHDGHDTDVARFGHDNDVDVVRVLREIGSEDAAFFEMLHDAGLDNQTMLMILKKLGPDPDVQKALEVAAKKSQYVELKLRHLHEQLENDVAAGHLSKEQATEKFHVVLEEVQRDIRPSLIAEATREMTAIKKQLAEKVAAGLITEAEAKERAYQAHEELKSRMLSRRTELHTVREHEGKLFELRRRLGGEVEAGLISQAEAKQAFEEAAREWRGTLRRTNNLRSPDPENVERLRKLHDEVRAELEAGRITEKEAEQRIHAAARQLHEQMAVREGKLRREMPDSMRARLDEIGVQIKADVAAGLMTREEGRDRMKAAKHELHEQYREEFERRHADKRHNEHND